MLDSARTSSRDRTFRPGTVDNLELRLALSGIDRLPNAALPAEFSSPAATLRTEIQETIGKTPGLAVSQLTPEADGTSLIAIQTYHVDQALSLATILPASYKVGGQTVRIAIVDILGTQYHAYPPTSAAGLAGCYSVALAGNRQFAGVQVLRPTPAHPVEAVYPTFTRSTVPFFRIRLPESYKNFTIPTVQAYKAILDPHPDGITVTPKSL